MGGYNRCCRNFKIREETTRRSFFSLLSNSQEKQPVFFEEEVILNEGTSTKPIFDNQVTNYRNYILNQTAIEQHLLI